MRATEVAFHILLRIAAFLMSDNDATMRAEFRQPARHRLVIAEMPIAMKLDPFGETTRQIIERKWTLRVPRDLHALPGSEVVVNLTARFADLGFHGLDLGIEIEVVLVRMVLQILEPPLQFQDRFLKIERLRIHR